MFNRVRHFREKKGLTQEALADEVGVTRQTIISIEAGRFNPSLELTFRIARCFDKPIEEIFSDDGIYPHLILAIPLPESCDGESCDGQTDVPDGSVSASMAQEAL